jgi:hypothetical protein
LLENDSFNPEGVALRMNQSFALKISVKFFSQNSLIPIQNFNGFFLLLSFLGYYLCKMMMITMLYHVCRLCACASQINLLPLGGIHRFRLPAGDFVFIISPF